MSRGVISLAWRLLCLATLASVLVVAAPAGAAASPGGSLTIAATGLPSGQQPSIVLRGPSLRRVITSQQVALRGLRPGHYVLTVRPIIVKHASRSVRSGATALPAKRSVSVTVIAGRTARVVASYGSVVNPGVRSVPGGLVGVSGNADDPSALVFSGRSRPPGVGTILTSGPTALLPVGLISKVTRTAHQHGRHVVSLTSVPITDAVPELSFQGSLQLKPAHGAAQEAGSAVPAQAASVPRAHSASACGISASSSLLRFGAHLDSVELREAHLGAWPPQLKLTLAVRTSETLGLGLLSVGLNCSWTLAEIGPFDEAIPVGPLLIPVYATLPLTVKLSLNGSVQAGSINVASTTVAHVAAGFDENAASLSEQGTNVWSTGPSISGSASLAATIGVQAGIGIAKVGNLHVEAAFGPEFDASTGQGCNLHIDLGSLSAGTEVFGQSLNTPAFTPFKIPLWSGCKPTGGGGGSGGGGGGSGGGGGGTKEGGGGPPVPVGRTLAASGHDSCALLHGTIKCWGSNEAGQLGDGSTAGPDECELGGKRPCATTPVTVVGVSNATQIALGAGVDEQEGHACAVLEGGSVDCWGLNSQGQLGIGTESGPSQCLFGSPCSPTPVAVHGLTNATQVALGADHSCTLLATGHVECWGWNGLGQLGDGTYTGPENECPAAGVVCSRTPVEVAGITNAVQIAAGDEHTCALLSGGAVDCWGLNRSGQLGDGTNTGPSSTCGYDSNEPCSPSPVPVPGISEAIQIAAGGEETCALLADHAVDCWGAAGSGQLGNGSNTGSSNTCGVGGHETCSPRPTEVKGIATAVEVVVGGAHVCARLSGGGTACWGYDGFGQLGDGTYPGFSDTPVGLEFAPFSVIAAGLDHTCAASSEGFFCWGLGELGEIGDGTTNQYDVPTPVSGL